MKITKTIFLFLTLPSILYVQASEQEKPLLNLTETKVGLFKSLSSSFLSILASLFKSDIFVEIGTASGHTSLAASYEFPIVHTIEPNITLYQQAYTLLHKRSNIKCYVGSADEILRYLLPTLHHKIVFFWFNAHCCENVGTQATTILTELEYIKQSKIRNAIVLISNIHLFEKSTIAAQGNARKLESYPNLEQVTAKIAEISSDYRYIFLKDMLLAYPSHYSVSYSPLVEACTISRLYNGFNYSLEEVLQAERVISKAQNEERLALSDLLCLSLDPNISSYGLCKYYILWEGLVRFYNKDFIAAYELFCQAYNRGLIHWRITWYKALACLKCDKLDQCKNLIEEILKENPDCAPALNLQDILKLQLYYLKCKV